MRGACVVRACCVRVACVLRAWCVRGACVVRVCSVRVACWCVVIARGTHGSDIWYCDTVTFFST